MKRISHSPLMVAMLARVLSPKYDGPTPIKMDIATTPREVMAAFQVWFNGELQTRCTVANTQHGYIVRYVNGIGGKTERLEGKVEFRRL